MNQVVAKIRKRQGSEVWVALTEYGGIQRLDIREYFHPDGQPESRPTQKGISVPVDRLDDLKGAVEALIQVEGEEGTVATLARSASLEIRVGIRTYLGRKYADVRTYIKGDGEQEWRPTKKGFTLNPTLLPELLRGLETAADLL